jgi:hypothetical protein
MSETNFPGPEELQKRIQSFLQSSFPQGARSAPAPGSTPLKSGSDAGESETAAACDCAYAVLIGSGPVLGSAALSWAPLAPPLLRRPSRRAWWPRATDWSFIAASCSSSE